MTRPFIDPPPKLTLPELGERKFEIIERGVCYRFTVPGAMVTFEIDRLTWHRQELTGELLVRCELLGTEAIDGVLSLAGFNVSSARARTERATLLARQAKAPDLPWAQLIEELCQRTLAAERSGEPALALRDVERPDMSDRLIRVSGFQLPRHHASCLFGDGGSCKSYLALYIGGLLAAEGHRVGLFDWELDAADHRERYEALFGADMPANLFYRRCSRPLIHEADSLKRIVRQQGLDFAAFDSVGFACHDAPETALSALAYFQAVRQIGVGSLHVAHVNKSETGDQKPFGSAFWHNSCRATWFIKPGDQENPVILGVFQRKANIAGRQLPFAIQATFGDRTTFRWTDIGAVEEFAAQVPVIQRVQTVLRGGAMNRGQIEAALDGANPEAIRKAISRALKAGHLVRLPGRDGAELIGLPARAS